MQRTPDQPIRDAAAPNGVPIDDAEVSLHVDSLHTAETDVPVGLSIPTSQADEELIDSYLASRTKDRPSELL